MMGASLQKLRSKIDTLAWPKKCWKKCPERSYLGQCTSKQIGRYLLRYISKTLVYPPPPIKSIGTVPIYAYEKCTVQVVCKGTTRDFNASEMQLNKM